MFSYVSQLSEACKLLLREDGREGKLLSDRHKALQTHNQFKYDAVLHHPRECFLLEGECGVGKKHRL